MKQNRLLPVVIVVIALNLVGCYDVMVNSQLSLVNRSGRAVSILYSNGTQTPISENNVAYFTSDYQIAQPDSVIYITTLGNNNAWHKYIEESKTKTLSFYIFETDTLKKYNDVYSMDNLIKQHKYFKLLCYSENELKKTNWKIVLNK